MICKVLKKTMTYLFYVDSFLSFVFFFVKSLFNSDDLFCCFRNSCVSSFCEYVRLIIFQMDDVLTRFLNSKDSKDDDVDKLIKMAKSETKGSGKLSSQRTELKNRQTVQDQAVQVGPETNILAKESVNNWLFKVSPQALPPPKLEISEPVDTQQFSMSKFSFEDDGSFADDPIMQLWRKRIQKLKNLEKEI